MFVIRFEDHYIYLFIYLSPSLTFGYTMGHLSLDTDSCLSWGHGRMVEEGKSNKK